MKIRHYMPWPFVLGFCSFYGIFVPNVEAEMRDMPIEITIDTSYAKGWEDGYCEGWKDVKGIYAICPVTPLCPLPEADKERYRDAYNRGFKSGRKDALK